MSRLLSPKDFGALNSILSLFSIETVPVMVVGMVIIRYVSQFQALQETAKLRLFLLNSLRNLSVLGILLALLIWLTRSWVGLYLRLESTAPIILLGVMVFFAFIFPVGTGYLQGLQLFGRLGCVLIFNGFARLIFGIVLVLLGYGVMGALGANVLAFFVVFLFFYQPFRKILQISTSKEIERHTKEILVFSIPVTLAFLGSSGLIFLDLILVNHFFSPDSVGQYAAAVILGRSIFYFPGALAMAMYPMAAEAQVLQKDAYDILKKCLILTGLLSGCGLILFISIPDFLIWTLFGSQYSEAGQLLSFYALAMFPFALSSVFIQFNLALKRFKFIYVLLVALALEWAAIELFHNSFGDILIIVNLTQWGILTVLGFLTAIQASRP
jgi:O-antigen/teichoic acid export membrane protein